MALLGAMLILQGFTAQSGSATAALVVFGVLVAGLPFFPFRRLIEQHGVKHRKVAGMRLKRKS